MEQARIFFVSLMNNLFGQKNLWYYDRSPSDKNKTGGNEQQKQRSEQILLCKVSGAYKACIVAELCDHQFDRRVFCTAVQESVDLSF